MTRISTIGVLSFLLATTGNLRAQGTIPKDLQGSWNVVSAFSNGKTAKALERGHWRLTFQDGKYLMRKTATADIVLDLAIDDQKDPKQIDFISSEKKLEGLYKIDGNSLTVLMPLDATRGRPIDFDVKEGVEIIQLRKAPEPADEFPKADAVPAKPRLANDADGVDGQWELIADPQAKGNATAVRLRFSVAKQTLNVQTESTGSFLGISTKNNSKIDVNFIADPNGMTGLIVVPINDGKKETLNVVAYRFRDEVLELYGEIVAPYIRTNITGQFRRASAK